MVLEPGIHSLLSLGAHGGRRGCVHEHTKELCKQLRRGRLGHDVSLVFLLRTPFPRYGGGVAHLLRAIEQESGRADDTAAGLAFIQAVLRCSRSAAFASRRSSISSSNQATEFSPILMCRGNLPAASRRAICTRDHGMPRSRKA